MSEPPDTFMCMASDSQVRQEQRKLDQLRQKLQRESAKIGSAHEKAAKAKSAADKTKSNSTRQSRLAEASRQDKKANDAEKERAKIESRVATGEKKLSEARRRYDINSEKERKLALDRMNASITRSEARFHLSTVHSDRPLRAIPSTAANIDDHRDVFISHASEDKDDIARPLTEALQTRNLSVWFDELNITWGTPIRRAVEKGITNATYGLVIISPNFIAKQWTRAELDALYGRQMGQPDSQVILPVWHRVTADDMQQHLPMIAGIKALNTGVFSIEEIANEVASLVAAGRDKS